VRYSVEEELLGNAGAVKKAARMIDDAAALCVVNGGSFLDLDVQAMWEFHHSRKALATVALVALTRANGSGHVVTNERGEIMAFGEKNEDSIDTDNGKGLINAGTYLLSRQFIDLIPDGRPVSIEKEMFPMFVGSGLHGFFSDAYFIDIARPDALAKAQYELPMRLKA
jgi:NDP-sugar pyrophosphorylase family protein